MRRETVAAAELRGTPKAKPRIPCWRTSSDREPAEPGTDALAAAASTSNAREWSIAKKHTLMQEECRRTVVRRRRRLVTVRWALGGWRWRRWWRWWRWWLSGVPEGGRRYLLGAPCLARTTIGGDGINPENVVALWISRSAPEPRVIPWWHEPSVPLVNQLPGLIEEKDRVICVVGGVVAE